ncbi:MAG: GTPase Era [Lachnospiraceae bacterium]|nr:GTPase Era [Lachnospiraceae bacterium]
MQEENEKKSGFCALIGRPNVGKSTLMNRIIGQKIAITSPKPQTTRMRIQTVYTEERGQIVFVDTPGIHKAKNKLGDYMMNVAKKSLKDSDVIIWLVEPSAKIPDGDDDIALSLKEIRLPVILVINKTDTVRPAELLTVIDKYKDLCDFSEIIPLSALKGDNVNDLVDSIYKYLPAGPYYFDEDDLTDQTQRAIVAEMIREKALYLLDKEVPHGIAVIIDRMEYRKRQRGGIYDIDATIVCEKASHKGMIIGKGGSMLKNIGTKARIDMEEMLECSVNLKLFVKVKEGWRDSDFLVSNYGYKNEE